MKKVFKIIGIFLGSIVSILILFVLIVIISGTSFMHYDGNESLSEWMKNIKDDTLISEIVIPGSHDAGTYDMLWLGETQTLNIEEQLNVGVRYFDIRVYNKDDKLIIYHDIINGVDFIPIITSIKQFILDHPSETLLLDFQHFKNDSQEEVLSILKNEFYDENLLIENSTNLSDLEFISNLQLKDARGKCIIFWGDRSSDNSSYLFLRNNDDCSHTNMSLNSYYLGDFHKGDVNIFLSGAHSIYFANIIDKIKNEHKGIFVLQTQLTDGNLIFGPWSRERSNDEELDKYIINLKNSSNLQYLNVIMRDFVNYQKCKDIIDLNYYKNNVNE